MSKKIDSSVSLSFFAIFSILIFEYVIANWSKAMPNMYVDSS